MSEKWVKPGIVLITLGLLSWFSPSKSFDPWHLLNPKKISTMIFALALIQIFGTVMFRFFGVRAGAIMIGFSGGLISSTATTASLARKSKIKSNSNNYIETISFLSATAAMLIEGIVLVWLGMSEVNLLVFLMFLTPLLATAVMIYLYSRKLSDSFTESEDIPFRIIPILKLAAFIISILLLSKILQNFFGQSGLIVLTFLLSLFEIHGAVIANVQLYDNGTVSTKLLSSLVAISILASFFSKLFLVSTLASKRLKQHVLRCTIILFLALFITWLVLQFIKF